MNGHRRTFLQSLSDLVAEGDAAEATLAYCVHEFRSLRDRAYSHLQAAAIWRATSDVWLLMSPDGLLLDANEGLGNRVGCQTSDLIGRPVSDWIPPDRPGLQLCQVATALSMDRPLTFETEIAWGWAEVRMTQAQAGGQPAVCVTIRVLDVIREGRVFRYSGVSGQALIE